MALMEEQKGKNKDSSKGESDKISLVTKLTKVVTTIQKGIEKIKTKDPLKMFEGVLDIVSSLLNLVDAGKPYSFIFRILSEAVGMFFTESRQNQPSVVHQLTDVVHGEMIHFNKRLQDQKYDGLKLRVSEQIFQLQRMKEGEKLDDPSLWNDYMQFLGELASRFESPLPFKYETGYLIEDPDVKDYVTAVVKYSEAHSCFMALLFAAKAKYKELRTAHEDDIATVDRKMTFQIKEAKGKLSFLSDRRFLTFLGRIEGGKLTKIVALNRIPRDRNLVETVRQSLGLSPMPDFSTIESSAQKVSQQAVPLRSVEICNWLLLQYFGIKYSIQFINEADFPIKIVSGEVGWSQGNQLQFEKILPPRSSYRREANFGFSTAGYILLHLDGDSSSSDLRNTRAIEFAASKPFYESKINMQDKTDGEFLRGLNAYNERSEDTVTLYFTENGKYYIAKAEIFVCWPYRTFRFIIQDFNPEAVGDGKR